uniref:SEA domain-containing protein n=1 Tax=Magallana gigas TaxID=29159 RepID=A0A8W8KVA5_MAGGI
MRAKGDAKGVVMTYSSKEITCSFEDISDYPWVCYHVKDKCCQQCRHFYTGIAGCEYGDRTSGCYIFICPANPSVCCGTCYSGPTLTKPPQKPTTKLKITLLIDITDDLSDDDANESVRSKVQAALTSFYSINGLKFISCTVRNIRKDSLKVEYHVDTAIDSQLITNMTALSKNMATGKSKVTYEGQEVTVSTVILEDTSGKALSPCLPGHVCAETRNGPVCRESPKGNTNEYVNIFIYVGIVAALLILFLLYLVYIYCSRKNRNSKPNTASKKPGSTYIYMNDLYYSQRRSSYYDKAKY